MSEHSSRVGSKCGLIAIYRLLKKVVFSHPPNPEAPRRFVPRSAAGSSFDKVAFFSRRRVRIIRAHRRETDETEVRRGCSQVRATQA